MSFYNELCAVYDVRNVYLSIVSSGEDALILEIIRDASRRIRRIAGRDFVPRIETRTFNPYKDARGGLLTLDKDLLAVTTLTNGDADTLATNEYVFEPPNAAAYPKWGVRLLGSSGLAWTYDTDPENAVSLAGIWGYHDEYADAWALVDTLAVAISSTSAATFTLTTSGSVKSGQLLKIDSEYIYAGNVSGTAGTLAGRGANGSTAATHLISADVYVWQPVYEIKRLACEVTAGLYRLRANPVAENFIALDGVTLIQPKDIDTYIKKRLVEMGLRRETGA